MLYSCYGVLYVWLALCGGLFFKIRFLKSIIKKKPKKIKLIINIIYEEKFCKKRLWRFADDK